MGFELVGFVWGARNPAFLETQLDLGVGGQERLPLLENEAERKRRDFQKSQPMGHSASLTALQARLHRCASFFWPFWR